MAIPARTLGALKFEVRNSLVTRKVQLPVQKFIHTQGVSSAFLLAAAIAALIWANSPWKDSYEHLWHLELTLSKVRLPIHAWINDALMALFFFLVGMEIKQEIVKGELSNFRRAALPIFAGLGGMVVPAIIYALLNHGRPSAHGWGVPMATDIAFSLGVLALVKGVPAELKIFLLSLAIADDIGAITVIALFYTDTLNLSALFIAMLLLAIILLCRRVGFVRPVIYGVLGFGVWLAVLRSGLHATIAGVILGFLVPVEAPVSFGDFDELGTEAMLQFRQARAEGDENRAKSVLGTMDYLVENTESTAEGVTRRLHDWIAFLVLPLFALSNAGVTFSKGIWGSLIHSPIAWGVVLGLLIGKPLGVLAFSWIAVKTRLAQLPDAIKWRHVLGIGVLAGIGFTVSLFIAALAFDDPAQLDAAKTAVLGDSLVAGVVGYLLLSGRATKSPEA